MSERRIVWIVALVQLVNVLDFMMVMPLGEDFARALAIDKAHIGYIGGAYTLAAAVSGLAAARFLDRFDRRRVLVVAMLGLSLGTFAGAFATSLETMIVARLIAGAFGGPATAIALAIIADVVPAERRGRAMGIVMAGFSLASVLGVPAGLKLARSFAWNAPFYAVGAACVIVTLAAAAMLPPLRLHLERDHGPRTPALELLARPTLRMAIVASMVTMFSVFLVVPNISVYLQNNLGVPRADVEWLYLLGGLVTLAILQVSGRAVDRVGSFPVAAVGAALAIGATLAGFGFDHALVPVPLFFAAFMASGSLRGVAMQTLVSRLPAPHERAQFMSLLSGIQHIASSLAAFTSAQLLVERPDHTLAGMALIAWMSIGLAGVIPLLVRWIEQRAPRLKPQ